jgi:NifU-like protein involved in Fe-S cluster formation
MRRLIGIVVLLHLAGCGADVASSAATAAAVKAKEVDAAQKLKEQVSETLEAANQEAQKRLEEADKAAQ